MLTKTATPDAVHLQDPVAFTLRLFNPNRVDVLVTAFEDQLPDGFSYVPGTTSGLTTSGIRRCPDRRSGTTASS